MLQQSELMKRVGSLQQAAYVRPVSYLEGRSAGLRAFEVKNGPLSYTLMADKCLDMSELSYKGVNFSFLSKPGLQGRNPYDTNGDEAIRSIMGGMFFTAGAENICAPCRVGGADYPMHGRLRTTPGEHLSSDAFFAEDGYHLRVSAEMREAALFGENMVLRRSIETVYGTKTVTLTDTFVNQSYRDEPLMLLYHINLGWPFLDENLRLHLPTRSVIPRDDASKGHESAYNRMDPPKENEPEYVFIHDLKTDGSGNTCAIAVNEALELGFAIRWNTRNLPRFMQWKSTAAGDYVIGLEPANSSVFGRPWHEERNSVHTLAPFAAETNTLTFTVLDGMQDIASALAAFVRDFR